MRWLFLVFLSTSLVSGYISQKSSDEIAYLSAAITVVTLGLSLVMAPWQVQLLILVVTVIIARQFWLKLESDKVFGTEGETSPSDRQNDRQPIATISDESEEIIVRKYRGASYEVKVPKINVTEVEREGKYRGADFTVRYLQKEDGESEKQ